MKPTLLAQKENNKQNRAERKTRVKVSEGPALLVLVNLYKFVTLATWGNVVDLFVRTELLNSDPTQYLFLF